MRQPPREPDYDPPISELEEGVLFILEDADVPTEVNDKVVGVIRKHLHMDD